MCACALSFPSECPSSYFSVKFRDTQTGIYCDLNINDRLGLLNSLLIRDYAERNPVLRPMIYLVKKWADRLGMNSPAVGKGPVTFSSYALTLMIIGYLQVSELVALGESSLT